MLLGHKPLLPHCAENGICSVHGLVEIDRCGFAVRVGPWEGPIIGQRADVAGDLFATQLMSMPCGECILCGALLLSSGCPSTSERTLTSNSMCFFCVWSDTTQKPLSM